MKLKKKSLGVKGFKTRSVRDDENIKLQVDCTESAFGSWNLPRNGVVISTCAPTQRQASREY